MESKMEGGETDDFKNGFAYGDDKHFGQDQRDTLETISNESLDSDSESLPVNRISVNIFDVNKDRKLSVMPILTKDDHDDEDFTVHPKLDRKSLCLIASQDPILKLDTLIKNFRDMFLGNSETLELFNEIGINKQGLLTKSESEGHILEHKSIYSHKSDGGLLSIQKSSPLLIPNKIKNDEIKLITMSENNFFVMEKPNIDKCHEKELQCIKSFEILRNINHTNDIDVLREIPKTSNLDSFTTAENQGMKEKVEFPSLEIKSSNYLEQNNSKCDSEFEKALKNDIFTLTPSENSSVAKRVVVVESDIEIDVHEAVRRDDELLLRRLLARGADPDEPDWAGNGDPPIVQAAFKQNIPIIMLLCQAGCDVNLTSVRGETALHMAVSRRPVSLPLIDTLLAAGCDANVQEKLRGCSALHCVSGFADDEPQVFQKLLPVTNVNLRDHRHSTVLHRIAATSNNVFMIKQVLKMGADLNIQNDRGETALCVALERGWEEGALTLVAEGTDLERTNLYRETALHVAARHDQANIVAALLCHGAEVNAKDLAGNTALHLAAGRGYVDTVRQLLTCPNLSLDTHNCDDATPLTCAVESGFISVVEMLVKAEKVDLQPALDLAKQGYRRLSQPEMCQLLTKELARRQTPHLT